MNLRGKRSKGSMDEEKLADVEARVKALEGDISYEERLDYERRHAQRKDEMLARNGESAELDAAVDGSFPASDPASPAITGDLERREAHAEAQVELDEALDDTFPASDVPAIVTPRDEVEPV